MAFITYDEKKYKNELLKKSYEYLLNNFYKFSDTNKLRISLELIKRRWSAQVDLSGKVEVKKIEVEIVGSRKSKT